MELRADRQAAAITNAARGMHSYATEVLNNSTLQHRTTQLFSTAGTASTWQCSTPVLCGALALITTSSSNTDLLLHQVNWLQARMELVQDCFAPWENSSMHPSRHPC